MSIYHLSFKICKRSDGKSSVYLAAYQNRQEITDDRTGAKWNYSEKPGFDSSFILAPANTPTWLVADSATLWNTVEATEKRKDAQLSRYFDVALPVELNREQQLELIRSYCQNHFVDAGMIADVALHDLDSQNPHAHVMLTMREVGQNGFGNKVREWNDRTQLENWREKWTTEANKALKDANSKSRIDHRSLSDQRKSFASRLKRETKPERIAYYQAKLIELDRDPMKRIHRNKWKAGMRERKIDREIKAVSLELASRHYFANRSPKSKPSSKSKANLHKSKPKPALDRLVQNLYRASVDKLVSSFDKLKSRLKPREAKVSDSANFQSRYVSDGVGGWILKSDVENWDAKQTELIKSQLESKQRSEQIIRDSERQRVKRDIQQPTQQQPTDRKRFKM
ncbi:MobQ family relaxase (plasmid) [Klebsiella pneumoniae]